MTGCSPLYGLALLEREIVALLFGPGFQLYYRKPRALLYLPNEIDTGLGHFVLASADPLFIEPLFLFAFLKMGGNS